MIIRIEGGNVAMMFLCAYLAVTVSGWWWLVAASCIPFWFFNPRWSKSKGWRFKHADGMKSDE